MKDQEKTRQQLIRELMELRAQAWQLESQHRNAKQALRESQQQLQQAQKNGDAGHLSGRGCP